MALLNVPIRRNNLATLRVLVEDLGIPVQDDSGEDSAPLLLAIRSGECRLAEYLLRQGDNPNRGHFEDYCDALSMVDESGHPAKTKAALYRLLRAHGARRNSV